MYGGGCVSGGGVSECTEVGVRAGVWMGVCAPVCVSV